MSAIRQDQVPEYLSHFESAAQFLRRMRDRHKSGSPQWEQFDAELKDCLGQARRLKEAFASTSSIFNQV